MSDLFSKTDINSILEYASKLKEKTLRDACGIEVEDNDYIGKGNFGQILEKYYFHYEPNSVAEPDFSDVGLELKSSPLKKNKNNTYSAKERLVLSIINYFEIPEQEFFSSSFYRKNKHLLLILYLYEKGINVLDLIIKLVGDWKIPEDDLPIIKADWELIQSKIKEGKAHELSEGDTFYLGACTKGGKGGNPREQPFSSQKAKQRAFAFKQGYLNHIIGVISKKQGVVYGRIIDRPIAKISFENLVISRFEKYYGKSTSEIESALGLTLNSKAKNYYASLTKKMLGVDIDKEIEEFVKADIIVKTVRLKGNNLPKEDISFPTFKYEEIINEEWDESDFKHLLEHKFLFIFFQFVGGKLILKRTRFWNMKPSDIDIAKSVWEKTKSIVTNGEIVSSIRNGRRVTNFPNKKFSKIAHVRPHAKNSKDTIPLPVKDKVTGLTSYTKHCFWLNNSFIKEEIYLK